MSADAGPIIPLRTSGGTGSLDIDLDPTELAALLGTSAQFQLVVSNQAGDSNPALFNVAFEPTKFVHLAHRADRGAAKVGEPISFSLSVSTNCAVAMDSVVDLRLSLSGLEFVSGSATYGGAFVDNPDHEGGELVFKSISVPSRSEMPRVRTYVARRRSATAGNATSRALAYLSRDPSKLVSDSGETGSGTVGDAMPALSCECSSGAGVASWLGVAAALSLVRRRRKRC